MKRFLSRYLGLGVALGALSAGPLAHGQGSTIYSQVALAPATTITQGDPPVNQSFVLSISSPQGTNLLGYLSLPITLEVQVLNAPAGVTNDTALKYITLTGTTESGVTTALSAGAIVSNVTNGNGVLGDAENYTGLDFALLGQLSVSVNLNFPVGTVAGSYAYAIYTLGWSSSIFGPVYENASPPSSGTGPFTTLADGTVLYGYGATINMNISNQFPTIAISSPTPLQTFTIPMSGSTYAVPYTITAGTPSGTNFPSTSSASATLTYYASGTPGVGPGVTVAPGGTVISGVSASFAPTFAVSATDSATPPNTIGLTTPAGSTVNLPVGAYTITATDTNNLNGTASALQSFLVVQGPTPVTPTIGISSPTNGQTFYTGVGAGGVNNPTAPVTYTITGTTPAGSNFPLPSSAYATVNLNGGTAQYNPSFLLYDAPPPITPSNATVPAAGTTINSTATLNLPPGTYTVAATDSNNTGGTATATQVVFTVVAGAPPTIALTTPTGTYYALISGGNATIPYNISGTTPAGTTFGASCGTATITNASGATVAILALSGTGTASFTSTGNVSGGLPVGTYSITATDIDNLGETATATGTFTVVTAATPTITLTTPAGTYYTSSGGNATIPYNISGTTPTGSTFGTSSGTATITNASGATVATLALSGTGTASFASTGNVSGGLPVGTYTISASDVNNEGGTAATSGTFTVVAAAAPTITLTTPAGTYYASSGGNATIPYNISGATPTGTTFGTSCGTATVTNASGATVATLALSGTGTASFTSTGNVSGGLPVGSYSITATDANNEGGTATTSGTFTVVAGPPPAPTIAITAPIVLSYTIPSGATTAAVTYTINGTTPNGSTFLSASSGTAAIAASGGGSVAGISQPIFTVGSGSTSITSTGTVNLTAGTYTITASDVNNLGGTATATQVVFTVAAATTGTPCTAQTLANASNFNGTPIAQGNYIWFNSVVNVSGLSGKAGIVEFTNSTIAFTVAGNPVTLIAPSATITFSATATSAATSYNASSNTWQTIVPVGYSGNVFLSGLAYQVPANFPTGLNPVTWSGGFLSDTAGVNVQWQWAAAVYTQFSSNLNTLGVKPIDSNTGCSYQNSDHAGTPENFTSYVTGGARGGGGSNYTGSYSGTVSGNDGSATSIAGLYATGVSNSGSLLNGGSTDSHYVVTASSMGSRYTGNSYVDPTPLAAGWVPNTKTAQWITAPGGSNIGNGAGNNGLPSSGSTARSDTYDYTLTFTMPAGANLNTASVTGTISADDEVLILVNGTLVTSNVPNIPDNEYDTTSPFTLNSSNATFQQGTNTITFRVANENTPTPQNASGLFVQSIGGTVSVSQSGSGVTYCPAIDGSQSQSSGAPPTITATNPSNGSTYVVVTGSGPVSVPVGFTANSPAGSGNITAVSATLNGSPLTLTSTTGVNSSATATGAATLSLSQAGTNTLVYSGANAYGSASVTVTFNVVAVQPPTITITAPADGSTLTLPSGSTSVAVPYTFAGTTSYQTIQSASITLNGSAVSPAPAISNLGTTAISGSGTLTLSAGTYTLAGTDSNGVATGTDQITFTVAAAKSGGGGSGSGSECLVWLQCDSFNQTYSCGQNSSSTSSQSVTGGTVVPISFGLYNCNLNWSNNSQTWNNCWQNWNNNNCNSSFVTDTSTVITVYEIYSNNTSSTPVAYTYSATGPNPPYYAIGNGQYVLNFPTAAGTHHYSVEVYHPLAGGSLQLLGSENIYTQGTCMPTACNNGSNFNGTPIAQGNCIWFNSVVNVTGLSSKACTLAFDTSTINFNLGKTACTVTAPAAYIKFDPAATCATTSFNASANCWVTDVPVGYNGNVFLSGVCYQVPANFPAGLNPVTWTGSFRSDTGGCNAQWQWAAAVYTQCSTDLTKVNVKACDSTTLCSQYQNSDHAGTPENYKSCVTGGARGGGGSNWTGSYSGTLSPAIGSNCWLDANLSSNNQGWNGWNSGWGW